MRDVLETLERWAADGMPVAIATVVGTERSAPRDPGAVLAVSAEGEVAGSVTGGCVEPAVYGEARDVLAGGEPRLKTYGIADDEAFEVGLPCGGTVHIFVDRLDPELVAPIAEAVREERPIALEIRITGEDAGAKRLVGPDDDGPAAELLARGETAILDTPEGQLFVSSFAPRPNMYVFGAVDHAAAVASIGRYLGYRVTVCDARAKFVTRERFPDVDELIVEWPDRFLREAPVDERTVICVLTHDHKFDVPALKVALETNGRLHRRHGRAAHERRAHRAAPRGGRLRRGACPHSRSDRPQDRLTHAGGGGGRDRGPDRRRSCARPRVRQEAGQ